MALGRWPLPPLEVPGRFLRAPGVDPTRTPAQPEEAAGLFRSLAAQRRLLVVLDNAATGGAAAALPRPGPGRVPEGVGRVPDPGTWRLAALPVTL